jgi:hypothetical protein
VREKARGFSTMVSVSRGSILFFDKETGISHHDVYLIVILVQSEKMDD